MRSGACSDTCIGVCGDVSCGVCSGVCSGVCTEGLEVPPGFKKFVSCFAQNFESGGSPPPSGTVAAAKPPKFSEIL